jgi:hypothetical protein
VFTHPSKQNLLSHRVLPISSSLLTKIHDYGSLGKEVERAYIKAMMGSLFSEVEEEKKYSFWSYSPIRFLEALVDSTSFCQDFVKDLNNNASSLSLRDVHRVKLVFYFYLSFLAYQKKYSSSEIKFEDFHKDFKPNFKTVDKNIFFRALLVSVSLNYMNRIVCQKQKQKLMEEVIFITSKILYFKKKDDYFQKVLEEEYRIIIDRVRRLGKLPKDIALNAPLKENLFAIFVAIYSKTPLFICGKPGSSKSVSVQIIKKSFDGQVMGGKKDFLDGMKPLRFEYYQGSDQSTDKGVEKVFLKALFHQQRAKKQSVVFIDEIGLAELSPNNPLKVLHKFLDTTSHNTKKSKIIFYLLI